MHLYDLENFFITYIKKLICNSNGPLFRALLVRGGENHYFFVPVVHHIIFDGWSWILFVGLREKIFQVHDVSFIEHEILFNFLGNTAIENPLLPNELLLPLETKNDWLPPQESWWYTMEWVTSMRS